MQNKGKLIFLIENAWKNS